MLSAPLLPPALNVSELLGSSGKWGEAPLLGSMQAAEASLPAISKATVFVMVSKGVPETEGDADIIHHVPGAFQHLQGRRGWGGELLGPLCVGSLLRVPGTMGEGRCGRAELAPPTTCLAQHAIQVPSL